mmetsp:Transcript_14231/g.40520  ORF Transcript_14231/g.40520 Transcript_14231/m.40520 type:complete len:93 (+) Transcript_14231:271-549(+)
MPSDIHTPAVARISEPRLPMRIRREHRLVLGVWFCLDEGARPHAKPRPPPLPLRFAHNFANTNTNRATATATTAAAAIQKKPTQLNLSSGTK